jgi:hypothetical protein
MGKRERPLQEKPWPFSILPSAIRESTIAMDFPSSWKYLITERNINIPIMTREDGDHPEISAE